MEPLPERRSGSGVPAGHDLGPVAAVTVPALVEPLGFEARVLIDGPLPTTRAAFHSRRDPGWLTG